MTAREVARRERDRLKQQDKLRREQLEQLRSLQNTDASKGEVRVQQAPELAALEVAAAVGDVWAAAECSSWQKCSGSRSVLAGGAAGGSPTRHLNRRASSAPRHLQPSGGCAAPPA